MKCCGRLVGLQALVIGGAHNINLQSKYTMTFRLGSTLRASTLPNGLLHFFVKGSNLGLRITRPQCFNGNVATISGSSDEVD